MKKEFSWCINPTEDEITEIWEKGTLTVDTNVLLDLYRYHEVTKNSLLKSLSAFEKIWLSRQATEEFFRNRSKVIISSENIFTEAENIVKKIQSEFQTPLNQLKANRIIPSTITENLSTKISSIIEEAQSEISKAKNNHPSYLTTDPILSEILNLFNKKIGNLEDVTEELKKEGERRKSNKLPPGYLDKDKKDDKPYGDYFLWNQILQYSKENETSIIFVTSERGEDWWEIVSGKTIDLRAELLREFYEFTGGQRILAYQTDRFLKYATERQGEKVDSSVVEEIRAVGTQRAEKENAVEIISQSTQDGNTEFEQNGELKLNLRRPVKNLTGSGHFHPKMFSIPKLTVKLMSFPQDMPEKYNVTFGAGTEYDFNVHVISQIPNVFLPVGEYIFEYTAAYE